MPFDSACPPLDAFRALYEAARPPGHAAALLRHADGCPHCRAALAAGPFRAAVHPALLPPAERTQLLRPSAPTGDWCIGTGGDGPPEEPELPRRVGRYEVVGPLGRGGMGVVVKALDPALNRFVAIKLLSPALAADPTARDRFAREAEAAGRVGSDNVVAVYEFGEADGAPYLVMQYARGQDLKSRLRAGPPVAPDEALRIVRQVAAGLAAAHAQGVVHRDIKPDNIILECPEELPARAAGVWARAKLADFGVARLIGTPGLTQPGAVMGTLEYMAPEQIEERTVDARSDLYALGLVLYRLLAGRPPFVGLTAFELMDHHCHVQPPPPSAFAPPGAVPEWLDGFVLRLLRKNPDDRVRSAVEVVRRLDAALADRGGAGADAAEERRLAALRRLEVLDTAPEQAFDDLTFLAGHICGTPIALISLVDLDRQWFKSRVGLSVAQTARSVSFCQHTIRGAGPFVVGDATTDPRFADNALVRGSPHIRFYAGMPLIDPAGCALGAMCVIDRAPRQLTPDQLAALGAIARLVVDRLLVRHELAEARAPRGG
jgi:serine/threonine protein kinase